MIHVDRSKFPTPEVLMSPKTERAKQELREFFNLKRKTRAQTRFKFRSDIYGNPKVRDALVKLFQGKCAYCESRLGVTAGIDVDQFRPKGGAIDLKGRSDPDHYYWLAYEWENLYPVCPICNRTKRAYFPVIGDRVEPEAMGKELRKEKPLLLDPCLDYPEMYFSFQEDGVVRPLKEIDQGGAQFLKQQGITNSRRIQRAEVSIDILALNRGALVEQRAEAAKTVNKLLLRPDSEEISLFEKNIHDMLEVGQPYLGMKRQLLQRWLIATIGTRSTARAVKQFLIGLAADLEIRLGVEEPGAKVTWQQVSRSTIGKEPLTKEAAAPTIPSLRTAYIRSIEIRNYRAIKDIRVEFAPSKQERVSWKVLIGENGTGKSSVLQAVALALMGEDRLEKFKQEVHLDPTKILRRGSKKGWVKIDLTGRKEPVLLGITRQGFEYESGAEGVNTFLNAYGTTRLLPHVKPMQSRSGFREALVSENLFNPFKPLLDVDKYLYGLKKGREFDSMALTLKDLLNLAGDSRLFRRDGHVWVQIGEDVDPLDELSDGYQSVMVISTDIMKNYPEELHDLRQAMGIVLVDEIGTYLHPRWKMAIVNSLRTAFPRIQFLATTHEPLCLRGLGKKEITVMERDEDTREILVNDDVPSPAGLRVDQLLTSDLFGLHSVIDPDAEKDFQEYYRLLAKRELTSEEIVQRDTLKKKLAEYDTRLGATPREQLLYEAIDDYLARKKSISPEKSAGEREMVKKKIAELWKKL